MRLFSTSTVLALLVCLTTASPSHGDGPFATIDQIPPAPDLVDRLVIDRFFRNDLLGAIRWASQEGVAGPSSRFYLGETYHSLGMLSRAADAYLGALKEGTPRDPWWPEALIKYLELLDLSPDLPPLVIGNDLDREISGDAALYFGSYLQRTGESDRARKLLSSYLGATVQTRALKTVAVAGIQADEESLEQSIDTLSSFRTSEPSAVSDLIYLLKGYGYLELDRPQQAREAFLAIPPSSPFSPEALYGQSWSLIMAGELPKAAVRFQELIDRHPYTSAARQGAIDLSLTFREMGLYDNATNILSRESDRLREMSRWLSSLGRSDFKEEGDLLLLIEGAVHGTPPHRAITDRNPEFVRQWILIAARNRDIRRTAALHAGAVALEDKLGEIITRYLSAIEALQQEVAWTDGNIDGVQEINEILDNVSGILPEYMDKVLSSLEANSLEGFATSSTMSLLGEIGSLLARLKSMETNVEKIRSFTPVLGSLKESPSATREEQQLNRIRENAYNGLVSSRNSLRDIRADLKALEGRVWFHVKGEARKTEMDIYDRVAAIEARTGKIRDRTADAQNMLSVRLSLLTRSREELRSHLVRLNTVLAGNLKNLQSNLRVLQADSLLQVADETRMVLEESEALALYTAADIEIMKMETQLRAMQDAVK